MNGLRLLDEEALAAVDARAFRSRTPYPWWGGPVLRDEAWQALHGHLPDREALEAIFGKTRRHGQQSHDRYALEYTADLPVHPLWHELVDELTGPVYHEFLARRFRTRRLRLRFHWHYTPRGSSVSPHCDARRKLGSHILYFNDADSWDPAWGGETWVLDDGGRFDRRSSPDFDDFDDAWTSPSIGNQSLLFARRGNSWHGVRELRCPDDELRRVFIVVVEAGSGWRRWWR